MKLVALDDNEWTFRSAMKVLHERRPADSMLGKMYAVLGIDKVKEVWYRLDVILKFKLPCISNNDMMMATDKQGNSLRSSSLIMCSRSWEDLEEDVC